MSKTVHRPRRWSLSPTHEAAAELAAKLKISPIVAQVLCNRGLSVPTECQDFLRPSLKCLHDPALLPNLTLAAERIARAVRDREKIVIYGDYDVDGITATAILWHAITRLGGVVDFYIPHRIEEGYGLNAAAIAEICDAGARLIVTVDCGVTAVEPAEVARQKGVDLIVTDHHDLHAALPACFAIVHPRLPGAIPAYPNPHLCGAGVAFKLAWGIGQAVRGEMRVSDEMRGLLVEITALAALGTIADVVPLIGENRVLAAFGLSGLRRSALTGLRALIQSAGLEGQNLDAYHVGFLLAPRLNACGRMGHAKLAVEMLTRADEKTAGEIAAYLESQNRARQAIERQILASALEQIARHHLDREDCRAIVLGDEGWHAGVIGIVASRLVDRFHRPTVMVALTNGHGQGSGRSVSGFHLANALQACGEHLEGFGGHEMAAGLKVSTAKFEGFRAAFCGYASRTIADEQLIPELRVDSLAELRHLSAAMVNDLRRLGPFGHGNRKPLLACQGVRIAAPPRRVGKTGDHLQLLVRQDELTARCIAFGFGDRAEQLAVGSRIDLAFEPCLNDFNGRDSVELEVKDIRIPASAR